MKPRLLPVYFKSGIDNDFTAQLNKQRTLLADDAEILDPVMLGSALPDADAVIFLQMLGDAYHQLDEIKAIKNRGLPLLVITSEFGTVSMWDWEINSYLKSEG